MSSIQPLVARGVDRSYGDRRILTAVDITVPPGARTGLIGENGVGKSTLLRILAGVEQPDGGSIRRPVRTGMLWQEAPVDESATVGELIDTYVAELRGIERELEDAAAGVESDPRRYERALEAAERAEVWTLESRREEVLEGLGVSTRAFGATRPPTRAFGATRPPTRAFGATRPPGGAFGATRPPRIGELSGGQRSRVALAGLLLGRPDALILDEPTNHLDDAAVAYLTEQLKRWPGPVLFASHDRAFLDEVATELVDLDPDRSRTATRYGGTFSDYLAEKARERERWQQQFESEQDELARLTRVASTTAREVAHGRGPRDNDKFIHKFKGANVQSAISRRVRDAERRRDVLEADAVRKPPPVLSFTGIPSGATPLDAAEVLVDLRDVRIPGRDGTDRLRLDRLTITARDRVLVTGPNGSGKSTLLAVLAGELGAAARRKGLRVGMLRQDIRFADPSRTAREVYRDAVGPRRADLVPLSDLGLLPPAQHDRPVGALSVGQQRRLALATVIAHPPHLFLLDEPSNHLSLALAVELEEALGSYPGAVVVASHDRWLRRRWVGRSVRLG